MFCFCCSEEPYFKWRLKKNSDYNKAYIGHVQAGFGLIAYFIWVSVTLWSSQQNWVVAFVFIDMLRRAAHAHIRRMKKDGEKALKVKTPFSIQCPDLLNERAVIQD